MPCGSPGVLARLPIALMKVGRGNSNPRLREGAGEHSHPLHLQGAQPGSSSLGQGLLPLSLGEKESQGRGSIMSSS